MCFENKSDKRISNMNDDEIRNAVITAIFSNDELLNYLTLKGGAGLLIASHLTRTTQDIDFSIKDDVILDKEKYMPIFRKLLTDAFSEREYKIINFKFLPTPKGKNFYRSSPIDSNDIIWGGYEIRFGIISNEQYDTKYKRFKLKGKKGMFEAIPEKEVEIDLSAGEYTEPRERRTLDGYVIYVYTPLMTLYEKARASAQQLPEYKFTHTKTRSRDFYDIYKLLSDKDLDLENKAKDPKNIDILKKMFDAKWVPLELLLKMETYKEELSSDYSNNVIPQIRDKDKPEFEFIFSLVSNLFKQLYEIAKKNSKNR